MAEERDLVIVHFHDSALVPAAWKFVEDILSPQSNVKAIRCVVVGFVLADTPQELVIAASIGDEGTANEQAAHVMVIPKVAITAFEHLPRRMPGD